MTFYFKVKYIFKNLRLQASTNSLLINCYRSKHDETVPIKNLSKILIANRGEIACRIIRTARKMAVQTVAVYSDADRNSLFVKMADEARNIGPAASQQSYLRQDKILAVAKETGAKAVHPGYGFLSENTEFAEACQEAGIEFIGPPSSAIRDMGIKSTSKNIMSKAGVPIIEGYQGEDQSEERLLAESRKITFPVMIKAVRGGGGKGMRVSMTEGDFIEQLDSAKREALKSFNDSVMLVEKYVPISRHVEVQVFGDKHGNYVYLYERDCSVQRRHQKIIEEAPAPLISKKTRKAIGEAAVKAARAVNYVGAGTVEFIMDDRENFFFMEMNTRLQVEHPVTEMITNTDLVQWQILVASGHPLPLEQSEIQLRGHAFEARIYAEDPNNNFMPGAGPLLHLVTPQPTQDVRIETGVRQGDEVSVHYDPMIAKLVVWSKDRDTALAKLRQSLRQYHIVGLETNLQFLDDLAGHGHFQASLVHTGFILQHKKDLFPDRTKLSREQLIRGALALILIERRKVREDAINTRDSFSPFTRGNGMRLNHNLVRKVLLNDGTKEIKVTIGFKANMSQFEVSLDDGSDLVSMVEAKLLKNISIVEDRDGVGMEEREDGNGNGLMDEMTLVMNVDGNICRCNVVVNGDVMHFFDVNGSYKVKLSPPKYLSTATDGSHSAFKDSIAPMPGVVDKVLVKAGDNVKKGDPLVVLIAMKMEHVIRASRAGRIKGILHKAGEQVRKDARLVEFHEIVE